jgi:hypothetical protein
VVVVVVAGMVVVVVSMVEPAERAMEPVVWTRCDLEWEGEE